jgi:hypothetical protein
VVGELGGAHLRCSFVEATVGGRAAKNVSYWETWPESGYAPSLVTLGRLAELYACDLADLVADLFCYRDAEWEVPSKRREFLSGTVALAAGALAFPDASRRVGADDVDRLRDGIRSLYVLDPQLGGDAAFRQALTQLRGVRQLLGAASYNPTVGRRLQVVAGELTGMAGWLAFDAGRPGAGRRLSTEALCLADLAESDNLKCLVLASMSLQAVNVGSGRESLEFAEAAQRAARPVATPKLSSLLASREALAHARLGDGARTGHALAAAERLLDEGGDAEDEDWVAFWGPTLFHGATALAQLLVGAPAHAERACRAALVSVNPSFQRNRAMYRVRLAEALVAQGEVGEGAEVATDALGGLGEVSSGRVRESLRSLGRRLEPHRRVPAVQGYLDQLGGC